MFHSLTTRLFFSRTRSATGRKPAGCKPSLEALEDRDVPAAFAVSAGIADGVVGSLRAAIIAANGNGQDDVITLAAGTHALSLANVSGQDNAAARGDLDMTEAGRTVTIQGQGAGVTVIDANQIDRVFQVMGNVTVVFRDLTIRNGVALDNGDAGFPTSLSAFGGGILNLGSVALERMVVENCSAIGGVPAGTAPAGTGIGGGVCSFGSLSVSQSTVRNNHATGGRGTANYGGYAHGGGIASNGPLTISQSTISGNVARGGRGGEGANGATNGAAGFHGGWAHGGGLFIWPFAQAGVVVNSTISGNQALGGAGGQGGFGRTQGGKGGAGGGTTGGGLYVHSALTLVNSTVADNQAHGGVGGPAGDGAFPADAGFNGTAFGGGVWTLSENPVVTSDSTLIANNLTSSFGSPDYHGSFVSVARTLLKVSQGAVLPTGSVGNLLDVDPRLGPLADNGGPTLTHALLAGSPAIDAGANLLGSAVDQRGFGPRVVGRTDIGAFELGANPSGPPAPRPVATPRSLVARLRKVTRNRRPVLMVEVRYADTGELKTSFKSPFQTAAFRQIKLTTEDGNSDGAIDSVELVARRISAGKKLVTRSIAI